MFYIWDNINGPIFRGSFYKKTLSLGDDLRVRTMYDGRMIRDRDYCRLIKVTKKGFNILDLTTNRVILNRHLYMIGMAGKDIPSHGLVRGAFWIPGYVYIEVIPKKLEKVS